MLLVALCWEEGDTSSSYSRLKRGERIKLHTSWVRDVTNAPSHITGRGRDKHHCKRLFLELE